MCPVPSRWRVRPRPVRNPRGVAGDPFLLLKKRIPITGGDPNFVPAGDLSPTRDVVGRHRVSRPTLSPSPVRFGWERVGVRAPFQSRPKARVPSRFRWANRVRRVERYRLDPLPAVWSTKGGAPSSSLPRPVKLAEPEFLRPCKQLGKYFGSEFGLSMRVGGELVSPRTRVGRGRLAPSGLSRPWTLGFEHVGSGPPPSPGNPGEGRLRRANSCGVRALDPPLADLRPAVGGSATRRWRICDLGLWTSDFGP
jgi:hypothetical protein